MSNLQVNENDKLVAFVNGLEDEFLRVQESRDISFTQEAYFAIQLLEKNDYTMKIARSNSKSLKRAVINVATIGLSLNPSMGLAYLVPRKNEVCLDISYLGLIKLAQDTGSIKDVKAEVVYSGDEFSINGAFSEPTHKFSPFGERGEIVGAYVVARTAENSFLTTTMSIDEIHIIRDSSESYKNPKTREYSPWTKHHNEMAKKTVIRRAYKSWPKTNTAHLLEKAIEVSDHAQDIEFVQQKTEYQLEQEQLDKDFPIPPEEKEIGAPTYRVQNAKFRGQQLKDIDIEDMADYIDTLKTRHEKNAPKSWELELITSMSEYLENYESESMANLTRGIEF